MSPSPIKHIAIVGGGTAGWMTAAALSHLLQKSEYRITLIESEAIGTVGVGEATIPHIRYFNQYLGIAENEFMQATQATYKLGIDFVDWGCQGSNYIHPFGEFGHKINNVDFHHYWLKHRENYPDSSIFDYSLPVQAAQLNKFQYPSSNKSSLLSTYSYAFHIDATKYALLLRKYSEERSVIRINAKIIQAHQDSDSGEIKSIELDNGTTVKADFFIDCSGFKSLLLGDKLGADFDDWSHWLPCDRAIAIPTTHGEKAPLVYTKAIAHSAGWQWQIPLKHRMGNGHVYCSQYMSSEEAETILMNNLPGDPLASAHHLKFKAGRRSKTWLKNCVAIGLSSGFLEPLESTSIYLIQIAIMKLIDLFPRDNDYQVLADEFNSQMSLEYDRIKDFIILHYHATERSDSEFWNYLRTMPIPSSLETRIEAFKEHAIIDNYTQGLFLTPSWIAVMLGQYIRPKHYSEIAKQSSSSEIKKHFDILKQQTHNSAKTMQDHTDALTKNSDKEDISWPDASMSLYGIFS